MVHIKRIDEMVNNKERFEYTTDKNVFPGFYGTGLDMTEDDEEIGEDYDTNAYHMRVAKACADKLMEYMQFDTDLIDNCKFKEFYQPKTYNYDTDHITIDCDVDVDGLLDWINEDDERRNSFEKYLQDNYTSHEGFHSYVPNTLMEFVEELNNKKFRDSNRDVCVGVMIDYYILDMAGGKESLFDDLYEIAQEMV